jgi:hypothetical protein
MLRLVAGLVEPSKALEGDHNKGEAPLRLPQKTLKQKNFEAAIARRTPTTGTLKQQTYRRRRIRPRLLAELSFVGSKVKVVMPVLVVENCRLGGPLGLFSSIPQSIDYRSQGTYVSVVFKRTFILAMYCIYLAVI